MTRHPSTEGNDLRPNRVDAQTAVTVATPSGEGRVSLSDIVADVDEQIQDAIEKAEAVEAETVKYSEGYAPGYLG